MEAAACQGSWADRVQYFSASERVEFWKRWHRGENLGLSPIVTIRVITCARRRRSLNPYVVAASCSRSQPEFVSTERADKTLPDSRLYQCRRRRKLATVCRRCDRGQIYCGVVCSAAARRASLAGCRRRYRSSERGRQAAKRRQRDRRAKADIVVIGPRLEGTDANKSASEQAPRSSPNERVGPPGSDTRASRTGPNFELSGPARKGAVAQSEAKTLVTRCTHCGRRTSGFVRSQFLPPPGPRLVPPWLDHSPASPSRASSLRSAQSAPGPSLGPRCGAKTGNDCRQYSEPSATSEILHPDLSPERAEP